MVHSDSFQLPQVWSYPASHIFFLPRGSVTGFFQLCWITQISKSPWLKHRFSTKGREVFIDLSQDPGIIKDVILAAWAETTKKKG